MIKRKISWLVFLVISFVCNENSIAQKESIVPIFEKNDSVGIFYTSNTKKNPFYHIFYYSGETLNQESWDKHLVKRSRFKNLNAEDIEIEFDTSQVLICEEYSFNHNKLFFYNAFPLCIKNKSNDTLRIEYEGAIFIILEAKNRNNKWVPIETFSWWDCAVGLRDFLLYPQQTACVKGVIYKGNFTTSLRFKIPYCENGPIYSKEFKMSIPKKLLIDNRSRL